jgi:hypothetical protein
MGRVALNKTKSVILAAIAVVIVGGMGVSAYIANSPSRKVDVSKNSQQQAVYIKYSGQDGQNALILLKKHAQVQTKHYSFGDLVTSIDGTVGNGPKYWTFYLNGKEASVGAGSYTTKSTDKIEWKLQ